MQEYEVSLIITRLEGQEDENAEPKPIEVHKAKKAFFFTNQNEGYDIYAKIMNDVGKWLGTASQSVKKDLGQ